MPIVINPDSDYAKELARWDTPKSQGGMKPDGYEPYPAMVYKAFARENGAVMCGDPKVATGDTEAHTFSQKCQYIVKNAQEHDRARAQGWRDTPTEAIAYYESLQQDIATAAAEALHAVQRMSPQAKAEFAAADAETIEHVTDVPRPTRARKKPGPKPKRAVVTTEG